MPWVFSCFRSSTVLYLTLLFYYICWKLDPMRFRLRFFRISFIFAIEFQKSWNATNLPVSQHLRYPMLPISLRRFNMVNSKTLAPDKVIGAFLWFYYLFLKSTKNNIKPSKKQCRESTLLFYHQKGSLQRCFFIIFVES